MGRPINKRYFGTLADADTADKPLNDTAYNIPVESAYLDGAAYIADDGSSPCYIVKQTGSRTFKVGAVGHDVIDECILSDKASGDSSAVAQNSSGQNEMVIVGYVDGQRTTIKKLTNRLATDFNNNRYTWTIQDDSSVTIMVLTAV